MHGGGGGRGEGGPPTCLLLLPADYLLPERRQINTGRGTDTQIGATVAQTLTEQRGFSFEQTGYEDVLKIPIYKQ
jgi:hypothetical protein